MKNVLDRGSPNAGLSRGERIAGTVILLMLAAIVCAYGVQFRNHDGPAPDSAGSVYGKALPRILPDPALAGWAAPTDMTQYGPESLHRKIDGRADFFLGHGVVGLLFGSYRDQRHDDRAVDVYWYTMSTATDAREAYLAEKPPAVIPASFGEDGYASGGAIFFRANVHYVQILPNSTDEDVQQAARSIAGCMAERISGNAD